MGSIKDKKVLLYSGGLDSYLINKLWNPDIKLYIDIKGGYNEQEKIKLPSDVIIEQLDLSKFEREDKIIPLRNLYFCMIASYYGNEICLGATAGDRVLDKSFEFASKTSELLSYLYSPQWWIPEGKKIKINLQYKDMTKSELLYLYLNKGYNLKQAYDESFSCYFPKEHGIECWSCKPCFRKWIAFAEFGFIEHYTPLKYIKEEILPLIEQGIYGRGEKEEHLIIKIYNQYKDKI